MPERTGDEQDFKNLTFLSLTIAYFLPVGNHSMSERGERENWSQSRDPAYKHVADTGLHPVSSLSSLPVFQVSLAPS